MKLSETPTNHILVDASTNSEWDCCSFALITLSETWKQEQAARLDSIRPYTEDHTFDSLRFYDDSAEFYQSGEEGEDYAVLLGEKVWAFVELDDDEADTLTPPENRLVCYKFVLFRDGMFRYEASGKHTGERFWTSELPLAQLLEQIARLPA